LGKIRVQRSKRFKEWFKMVSERDKRAIDRRIESVDTYGCFIGTKSLDPKLRLFEFKWARGLRVYFGFLKDDAGDFILITNGGNKNSQSWDIDDAKNIIINASLGIQKKMRIK